MSTIKRRQLTWLFDLDNTLHDASHAIFPAIHLNMNVFIARVLRECGQPCDEIAVNALRVAYWQRYGATLLGMVNHHQVRAEDFLHDAHRFDDLATMIRAERGLVTLLRRLPGRKILLTNAPQRYSREVLRHIGLHRHFAKHVAVEAMQVHRRLRPKPSRIMLRKLMARERLRPQHCVLVEDTLSHLKAAKALGLKTVFVTRYVASDSNKQGGVHAPEPRQTGAATTHQATKRPIYVDVKVKSVGQLFRQLHRLR
jgi:putative hydrolase of the HAD superfamily